MNQDENSFESFDSDQELNLHRETNIQFPQIPPQIQHLLQVYHSNQHLIRQFKQKINEFQEEESNIRFISHDTNKQTIYEAFDENCWNQKVTYASPFIKNYEEKAQKKEDNLKSLEKLYHILNINLVEKMMMNNAKFKSHLQKYIHKTKRVVRFENGNNFLLAICQEKTIINTKLNTEGKHKKKEKSDSEEEEKNLKNTLSILENKINTTTSSSSLKEGEKEQKKFNIIRVIGNHKFLKRYKKENFVLQASEEEHERTLEEYLKELEKKKEEAEKDNFNVQSFKLKYQGSNDDEQLQILRACYSLSDNLYILLTNRAEILVCHREKRDPIQILKLDLGVEVSLFELKQKYLLVGSTDGAVRAYKQTQKHVFRIEKIYSCWFEQSERLLPILHYCAIQQDKSHEIQSILFVQNDRKVYELNCKTYQIKVLGESPAKILKIQNQSLITQDMVYHHFYFEGKLNLKYHEKLNQFFKENHLFKQSQRILQIIEYKTLDFKEFQDLSQTIDFLLVIDEGCGELSVMEVK